MEHANQSLKEMYANMIIEDEEEEEGGGLVQGRRRLKKLKGLCLLESS